MYEYRFLNTVSTRAASICDEEGNTYGTIQKYYNNFWERAGDLLLKGRFSGNYKIFDDEQNERFRAQRSLNIFKRRQYEARYMKDQSEETIRFVDEKNFGAGETTSFVYNDKTFELTKGALDKARISKDGAVIAEWNSSLKVPLKAYFNIIDSQYEEDRLLFLGIFHTYLHAG